MTRDPQDTSAAEPDGGNLQVRFQRGPGLGNRPGLLNNKCDWPPGLGSPACPFPGDTRVCGAYLRAFPSPYVGRDSQDGMTGSDREFVGYAPIGLTCSAELQAKGAGHGEAYPTRWA
jgi:hypothetical protein